MNRSVVVAFRSTRRKMGVFGRLQDASTKLMFGSEKEIHKDSFYDIVDKDMDGNEVKMSSFRGDVVCCVNVASK